MEGDRHDSVCEVKGLLDSVAMVNINVNVEHPRMVPSEVKGQVWRRSYCWGINILNITQHKECMSVCVQK